MSYLKGNNMPTNINWTTGVAGAALGLFAYFKPDIPADVRLDVLVIGVAA